MNTLEWAAVDSDRRLGQWSRCKSSLGYRHGTGLGPVGLGGIINAHYAAHGSSAVESHPYRAELAKKLGAEVVFNPTDSDVLEQILDFTDGVGVDKAVDCSGASAAHRVNGRCSTQERTGYIRR